MISAGRWSFRLEPESGTRHSVRLLISSLQASGIMGSWAFPFVPLPRFCSSPG
jgi:hypothetical protein